MASAARATKSLAAWSLTDMCGANMIRNGLEKIMLRNALKRQRLDSIWTQGVIKYARQRKSGRTLQCDTCTHNSMYKQKWFTGCTIASG